MTTRGGVSVSVRKASCAMGECEPTTRVCSEFLCRVYELLAGSKPGWTTSLTSWMASATHAAKAVSSYCPHGGASCGFIHIEVTGGTRTRFRASTFVGRQSVIRAVAAFVDWLRRSHPPRGGGRCATGLRTAELMDVRLLPWKSGSSRADIVFACILRALFFATSVPSAHRKP